MMLDSPFDFIFLLWIWCLGEYLRYGFIFYADYLISYPISLINNHWVLG